jgi:hypothetical protein
MRSYEDKRPELVSIEKAAAALGITEAELNKILDAGEQHLSVYGKRWLSASHLAWMLEHQHD